MKREEIIARLEGMKGNGYEKQEKAIDEAIETLIRMKYVQETVDCILNTCKSNQIADIAMRNAAKFIQNAIDGSDPDFEKIEETEPCDRLKLDGMLEDAYEHGYAQAKCDFEAPPCDAVSREFQDLIVEYLPAELCTYPEYRGKPYFSIKYKENGQEFVGYGTYNPDVMSRYLRDYFIKPSVTPKQRWIPVSERLPEDLEPVNITWVNHEPEPYYHDIKDKNFVATGIYYRDQWYWYSTTCADYLGEYGSNEVDKVDDAVEIVAWMPLPEPYKEGESE